MSRVVFAGVLAFLSVLAQGADLGGCPNFLRTYEALLRYALEADILTVDSLLLLETQGDPFGIPATAVPNRELLRASLRSLKEQYFSQGHSKKDQVQLVHILRSLGDEMQRTQEAPVSRCDWTGASAHYRRRFGSREGFRFLSPDGKSIAYLESTGPSAFRTLVQEPLSKQGSSTPISLAESNLEDRRLLLGWTRDSQKIAFRTASTLIAFRGPQRKGISMLSLDESSSWAYSPEGRWLLDREKTQKKVELRDLTSASRPWMGLTHHKALDWVADDQFLVQDIHSRSLSFLKWENGVHGQSWVELPFPSLPSPLKGRLSAISAHSPERSVVFLVPRLAQSQQGHVLLFNREGHLIRVYSPPPVPPNELSDHATVAPNGRTFLIRSRRSKNWNWDTLHVFSTLTETWSSISLERYLNAEATYHQIAFTPDGTGIVVVEHDGKVAWYE